MNKFVLFVCREQYFAVTLDSIEKILLFQKPARIPDTSAYLLGYLPYEEEHLTLIDMNMRLFQEASIPDEETKIMVVHWRGKKLGLVVDQVLRVQEFYVDPKSYAKPEDQKTKYIIETFQEKGNIVLHLDIDQLFQEEGVEELLAIIEK